MYVVGDYVSTNVAVFLFAVIRYFFESSAGNFQSLGEYLLFRPVMEEQIFFPLGMLFIYWLSGYYNRVFLKSRLQELNTTFMNCIAGVVVFFLIALVNDMRPDRLHTYLLIVVLLGLLFVCVYSVRRIVTHLGRAKVRDGLWAMNTIIIGPVKRAMEMKGRLDRRHRVMGYRVVGFISDEGETEIKPDVPSYEFSEVEDIVTRYDVKAFVVVIPKERTSEMRDVINRLLPTGCSVLIAPDTYEMLTTRIRTSNIAGEPLVNLASSNIPQSTLNVKRLFDIVFSIIGLVVSAPVIGVLAVLIKKDSPGGVIFRQQRVGLHKRPFMMFKLRTMVRDAESNGPVLTVPDDPRITRIGTVMRKYRLDELPQFWNILRGDMSFVGPRPEREFFVRQLNERIPSYALLQQVKPGLTSWGMVKYGYASTVEDMIERLRYDLIYLDNVSLGVDMKILLYTIKTVVTGKGL